MAAGSEAEMVLELLEALVRYRPPKTPARLSPAVEHAYELAEQTRRELEHWNAFHRVPAGLGQDPQGLSTGRAA